LKLSYFYSYWD